HRRRDLRPRGGADRPRPRSRARRGARGACDGAGAAHRAGAHHPARHVEAALQPDGGEHGHGVDPAARLAVRRRRPPHAGGPRLRRPGTGRGLPPGSAGARRSLRRLRVAATMTEVVADLLSRMTREEKLAQLVGYWGLLDPETGELGPY